MISKSKYKSYFGKFYQVIHFPLLKYIRLFHRNLRETDFLTKLCPFKYFENSAIDVTYKNIFGLLSCLSDRTVQLLNAS